MNMEYWNYLLLVIAALILSLSVADDADAPTPPESVTTKKKGLKGLKMKNSPFKASRQKRKEESLVEDAESNLYNIESKLAEKEKARTEHLFKHLQENGYEIHGFYHTSAVHGYWKEVISEQLQLLDGKRKFPAKDTIGNTHDFASFKWDTSNEYASLLQMSTSLTINVATQPNNKIAYENIQKLLKELKLKNGQKIKLEYNNTLVRDEFQHAKGAKKEEYNKNMQLSCGEYSTIDKLQRFCEKQSFEKQHHKTLIYYIHNKGSCCIKDQRNFTIQNPRATWREYMNAMNIEFPSICMRALTQKNYLVCGVENQDAHYSGNYWWATCDHIARLPKLENRYDYLAPEFFVLRSHPDFMIARNFGFTCGYSIYNCGVNLYDFECKRSKFRERITKYVHYKLGSNNVGPEMTRHETSPYTEKCKEVIQVNDKYYKNAEKVKNLFEKI